jgi:ATP-binding cassette subfamily A (ABC1) protein 2
MSTDGMSSQSSFVSRCSAARVTDFILKHVDTAYLKCDTGRELQYVLPFDEACKGHFSRLFTALDQHLASLEISSYGVMDTSLEEVFIAVNESQQASSQGKFLQFCF